MINAVRRGLPLLAPGIFAIARLIRSRGLLEISGKLDGLYTRAFLSIISENGWNAEDARRFAIVPSFLAALNSDASRFIRDNFSQSQSQILQDLFVLICLNQKKRGYFVEVGVGDGKYLSNTYLLEKFYGWEGVLAEPNNYLQKNPW